MSRTPYGSSTTLSLVKNLMLRGTSYTFSRFHRGMDRYAQPCRLPQDAEPLRWLPHVPAHVQASGYLHAAGVKQPLEQAH